MEVSCRGHELLNNPQRELSMRIIKKGLEAFAVLSAMLIAYNVVTVAEIAAGKHLDYVPWLHFPIKWFATFAG